MGSFDMLWFEICMCVCVNVCVCVCVCLHVHTHSLTHAHINHIGFAPQDTEEHTEIMMSTPFVYVVTIELTEEKFQNVYDSAPAVTKISIQEFIDKWKANRLQILEEMKAQKLGPERIKLLTIIRRWEFVCLAMMKPFRNVLCIVTLYGKYTRARRERVGGGGERERSFHVMLLWQETICTSGSTD